MALKTRTEQTTIHAVVHEWLDQGLWSPNDAFAQAETLRREGKGDLADILRDALRRWHDKESARLRAAMARNFH